MEPMQVMPMAPPGAASSNGTTMMHHGHMMHMTFFWGKNVEILFQGWPGYDHLGMYVLALVVVFLLALAVEWFSHCNVLLELSSSPKLSTAAVGLLQTLLYSIRIGLAFVVMLAVMSFNGGVFVVAVAGHGVGFFFFGSKAFKKQTGAGSGKTSDLPPTGCC